MKPVKLNISTFLMFSLVFGISSAQPYIPDSVDVVLLKLDKQQVKYIEHAFKSSSEQEAILLAADWLSNANQPGNSQQYQMVDGVLAPFITASNNSKIWYQWAQVKQHQHQFTEAQDYLAKILSLQPHDVAARLMAARLALISRDSATAKQHCQALLGHVDVITTQICLLEVVSYQGQLDDSYTQLLALINRWPVPNSHQTWVTLMLTDMAMRINDYQAAANHLQKYPAFNDISYLTTWADVLLAMQDPKTVTDRLVDLIQSGLILEDGLMLRLAMAEQQLNQQNSSSSDQWVKQLDGRLSVRAERGEFMHANEMARYFLYLKPNKQQAQHWAELNWQESKEHQDELLLQQAQQFMEPKTS